MSQDPRQCAKEQFELSNCIKEKVPSIQKIQSQCKDKMVTYESCLRNTGKVDQCVTELEDLRKCATGTL